MYVLSVIKNMFYLLDGRTRRHYYWLQGFFLISALIQIAGIGSIAPFISILSNPELVQTNVVFSALYELVGSETYNEFILMFALCSILLLVVAGATAGATLWFTFRFSMRVGREIQNGLLSNLLDRQYLYHKINDSSKSIAIINQEAPRFVYMVLVPFLIGTSQLFIGIIILVGLFLYDPVVAVSAGVLIGGSYLLTYVLIKKLLSYHGNIMTERNVGVQATLSEAFSGVKEIIITGKEDVYKRKFEYYNWRGIKSNAFIALAGDIPKIIIETITFSSILLFAIYMLNSDMVVSQIIAMLSVYGVAGYKLLPAMQQVYHSSSSISANGAVVMKLVEELRHPIVVKPKQVPVFDGEVISVGLSGVSFAYPNSNVNALSSVNVNFSKGAVNAIVGSSGSGKSTLTDIALGLLTPSEGCLMVNNQVVSDEGALQSYQRAIGYVPQNIFLTNESVLANVAFGVEPSEIDEKKVIAALKLANAYEFVQALPIGINTVLGQDGKLLSGGQRQRIGIARSLYGDTKVLILDEPTSALDIHSEHDFMNTLAQLKEQVLVILISHSASVIKMSDTICYVHNGVLEGYGDYEELSEKIPEFKAMMKKADLSRP